MIFICISCISGGIYSLTQLYSYKLKIQYGHTLTLKYASIPATEGGGWGEDEQLGAGEKKRTSSRERAMSFMVIKNTFKKHYRK